MSIMQKPRRITSESVSDETKHAVDTIGSSFNAFASEAYTAIMGNLSITDNLNMEFKTLTVEVDSSGVPKETVAYKSSLSGKTIGTMVVRTFLNIPDSQPHIGFVDNSGLVTISYVTGLAADTEYQLVIVAIGL